MKSVARTIAGSRTLLLMINSIWKAVTVQIRIFPICWEVTSHEPEAAHIACTGEHQG